MKQSIHYIIITLACCLLATACVQEDLVQMPDQSADGSLQLNLSTKGLMDQFVVTTRGTDVKTPEEQEIKSLHIFIFDASGNYLEAADQHRYQGYRSIPDGKTVMNIDRNGWEDNTAAQNATVIAVANVEAGTFQFSGATDEPPTNVPNRSALENFVYKPATGRYVTQLPQSGMPMYARVDDIDLTTNNTAQSVDIPLKALMARIDVSLQINSKHSDVTGSLPQLTVTGCKVLNAPQAVCFTENIAAETDLTTLGKADYDLPPSAVKTIQNGRGVLEYTFYTFENLQEPATPPGEYNYPTGITDDEKQRYKPELADKENALVFQFSGNYITYNGANYEATYTLYLGANHTDDFKVMRNKQYKNNVTIKGIVNAGNNPEHITFDTRVNITESNPYFISMLKDRTLDSHFNVVPMDVYFFNANPSSPVEQRMTVEILDPTTKASWVRMEKVPASYMKAGTAPSVSSGPELLVTGEAWHAGNGKRKYFTTDLVTNTLSGNTRIDITASRDRIYFYVDENLDVWHLGTDEERTRTATVQLTYYEDGEMIGTPRTLTLEQAKLLEVTFHRNSPTWPWQPADPDQDEENNMGTDGGRGRFYIEAYEEYLDHGDPLNEYENNQVYTGLPWEDYTGASGTEIGSIRIYVDWDAWFRTSRDCRDNYYWGHDFTSEIVDVAENPAIETLTLNDKPRTAAGYCYLKNKRNPDGSFPDPKWYLPGIRELERLLEDYYIEYPEFQQNYYWSSAAGEAEGAGNENLRNARATKAYIGTDGNFHYYESGMNNTYTGENGTGGFAPRRTSLRIRAARIDANAQ